MLLVIGLSVVEVVPPDTSPLRSSWELTPPTEGFIQWALSHLVRLTSSIVGDTGIGFSVLASRHHHCPQGADDSF